MVEPTAKTASGGPGPDPDPDHQLRLSGRQLLRRLLFYHTGLALAVALLVVVFPASVDYLPIGGISDLADRSGVYPGGSLIPAGEGPTTVTATPSAGATGILGHAPRLALVLVGIWLLMLPVSWLHRGIYQTSNYDHSIDETTLILPGVVAAVVVVVQHSLALAFALAGIAASVRFRRALQDTYDAQFILVAIGAGIAAGVGALEIAAVLSIFFCYATLYLCCFGDGLHSDFKGRQKAARKLLSENGREQDGATKPDPE